MNKRSVALQLLKIAESLKEAASKKCTKCKKKFEGKTNSKFCSKCKAK